MRMTVGYARTSSHSSYNHMPTVLFRVYTVTHNPLFLNLAEI